LFNWLNLNMDRAYAIRTFLFKAFARTALSALAMVVIAISFALASGA
jgi:hypothetical protein